MTEYRYANRAARLLRAARGRIGPHPAAPPADAVAALASVIRSTAGRRHRRRIAISIGTAAAIVSVAVMVGWTVTRSKLPANPPTTTASIAVATAFPKPTFVVEGTAGATVVAADGLSRTPVPGQGLRSGEELRTGERPVALAMRDDSAVEVEPHSDLQLVRADFERWLRLGSGAVEVHVAKLKSGERFVIATPDAEVEVRGTRFRVAVVPSVADCGRGTVTRVSVTEGVVVVRSLGGQSRV
ncbi:MAG TPA: FecR domain-containing protein, partial [Polyangia bacterium]